MSSAPTPVQVATRTGDLAGKQLRVWTGTVLTDASGNWTCDYTEAMFTSVPKVFMGVFAPSATTANAFQSNITAKSMTGAGGFVTMPKPAQANALLGLSIVVGSANQVAASGVSIDLLVMGV